MTRFLPLLFTIGVIGSACSDFGGGPELDTNFEIPRTEAFPERLSSYGLYQGNMAELVPAQGVHLYDISSALFTDYARKQRLIKLPEGQRAAVLGGRVAEYPDGTIVAKTFSYWDDFRDASLGHRVIETRVMVKTAGVWNVATYIWDEAQTDATLSLEDVATTVRWIDEDGVSRSTLYEIPGEVACVTCHQRAGDVALLGLIPRNLNRPVSRGGQQVAQLEHLQELGVFGGVGDVEVGAMVDFNDTSRSLESRARAYLDVNCSHCHSPDAWGRSAREGFDFRYEVALGESGIAEDSAEIAEALADGEMPFVGTTVLDDEGIALVLEYLDSL